MGNKNELYKLSVEEKRLAEDCREDFQGYKIMFGRNNLTKVTIWKMLLTIRLKRGSSMDSVNSSSISTLNS